MTKNVSQKTRQNPARSIRKMAKEMGSSRESMRRVVREDLDIKAYKLHKRELLITQNNQKRLEKSKIMLSLFADGLHEQMLFSDEKFFTFEQIVN